jgi:hypothetical protein
MRSTCSDTAPDGRLTDLFLGGKASAHDKISILWHVLSFWLALTDGQAALDAMPAHTDRTGLGDSVMQSYG